MTSFLRSDRSTPVAVWLWFTALVVFCLVVVGGVTRLTDSGLSITQWKPISGALPPMSHQAWLDEFALYQRIPQYRLVNPDMTVESFKSIYWWEWSHRLLGRAVGVVFALPFVYFLIRREIPRRLIVPCFAILGLGALQGLVGWWMVSSGLSERVTVAPERLTTHLGLALLLFVALIWTGLSAFAGQPRQSAVGPWKRWTLVFLAAVYLQCLLGALVAGNDAGMVYNDWPLFNGAWWPRDYFGATPWATIAHSHGAVQAHHRVLAYLVFAAGIAIGAVGWRSRIVDHDTRMISAFVAGAVTLQAVLGVATLMAAVPVWLGALHQAGGAGLLALATALAWRVRRI